MQNLERLQKVMASCGVASRRKSEEIILAGRVKVNGEVITELGTKVSPADEITVDGQAITRESFVYYALNKPTGYITTVSDEHNRRTVMDLISPKHKKNRIYPVGRLDYDTSGLLLLTNDGTLAYNLTRSNKEVPKSYVARVEGIIKQGAVNQLMKGIMIEGVLTKPATVEVGDTDKVNNSCSIKLTITEGRNRQVRHMLEYVGHPVKKLKRIQFADIKIDGLTEGSYRELTIHEVKTLYKY